MFWALVEVVWSACSTPTLKTSAEIPLKSRVVMVFVNKETNKFNEEPNFSIDTNSEIQKTLIIEDVLINEKAAILINSNFNNENDNNLKNT